MNTSNDFTIIMGTDHKSQQWFAATKKKRQQQRRRRQQLPHIRRANEPFLAKPELALTPKKD